MTPRTPRNNRRYFIERRLSPSIYGDGCPRWYFGRGTERRNAQWNRRPFYTLDDVLTYLVREDAMILFFEKQHVL